MQENAGSYEFSGTATPETIIRVLFQQIADMRAQLSTISAILRDYIKTANPQADLGLLDRAEDKVAAACLRDIYQDLGLKITDIRPSGPPATEIISE